MKKLNLSDNMDDYSEDEAGSKGQDNDVVSLTSDRSRVSSIGKLSKVISKKKLVSAFAATASANRSMSPDNKNTNNGVTSNKE